MCRVEFVFVRGTTWVYVLTLFFFVRTWAVALYVGNSLLCTCILFICTYCTWYTRCNVSCWPFFDILYFGDFFFFLCTWDV